MDKTRVALNRYYGNTITIHRIVERDYLLHFQILHFATFPIIIGDPAQFIHRTTRERPVNALAFRERAA